MPLLWADEARNARRWLARGHRAALLTAFVLALPFVSVASGRVIGEIDQGPILRVLRLDDVPGAKNENLPTGVLSVGEFGSLTTRTREQRRTLMSALRRAGYESSAVSAFVGPGTRRWDSLAVEFATAHGAEVALAAVAHAAASAGTGGSRIRVGRGYSSIVVVFGPKVVPQPSGFGVFRRRASYVYGLSGNDTSHPIRLSKVEQLLHVVIDRGGS